MAHFKSTISGLVVLCLIHLTTGYEYGPRAREEPSNYGAWYQLPQPPSAYPPSTYDRAPPGAGYVGYPRPYSRSPDYYPESAVTNNMVPAPRKPTGYYPSHAVAPNQDPDPEYRRRASTQLPVQTMVMRIFQMVQYHLTHAAWEYDELKRITDPDNTGTPRPLDLNLDIFGLGSTPAPRTHKKTDEEDRSGEDGQGKIERMVKYKKTRKTNKKLGNNAEQEEEEDRSRDASYEVIPVQVDDRSREKKSSQEDRKPRRKLAKIPNQELINAVKEVIKTFKKSLDRTGVHEDVRQMGSQIETTWNDLKRGMQRSWVAFRQSAENAVLTPLPTSTPLPVDPYPFIITRQQAARDTVEGHNGDQSSFSATNLAHLLRNVVNEPDDNVFDSGKFDQWIDRANQMLADSVTKEDAAKLLAATDSLRQKSEFEPSQIPKEKTKKADNPKFNASIQQ